MIYKITKLRKIIESQSLEEILVQINYENITEIKFQELIDKVFNELKKRKLNIDQQSCFRELNILRNEQKIPNKENTIKTKEE
jgi:hypothetical protein